MNTQTISLGVDVLDVTLDTRLDRVSFSARPGTLTALIGPSGAGKSTLARVLAGATRPDSGAVHFDGTVGMVPQDDILHGKLTVAEALAYAAELRGATPRPSPARSPSWSSRRTPAPGSTSCPAASANESRWHWSC